MGISYLNSVFINSEVKIRAQSVHIQEVDFYEFGKTRQDIL